MDLIGLFNYDNKLGHMTGEKTQPPGCRGKLGCLSQSVFYNVSGLEGSRCIIKWPAGLTKGS